MSSISGLSPPEAGSTPPRPPDCDSLECTQTSSDVSRGANTAPGGEPLWVMTASASTGFIAHSDAAPLPTLFVQPGPLSQARTD